MRNTINNDNITTHMRNTCDTLGCQHDDLLTVDFVDDTDLDYCPIGGDSYTPTMREIIQYYQDHFGT